MARIWQLISSSFSIWFAVNASQMSAAMTYFTMLSLAPLLVIALAIAGVFFSDRYAQQEIVENVQLFTSADIAETVAALITNTSHPQSGFFAGMISLAILVFSASGVFSQLQEAFDNIWGVPIEDRQGIWMSVKSRLAGILMVIVVGFLLITTLAISTAVGTVSNLLIEVQPGLTTWLAVADRSVSFFLMPPILLLIFWLIPKANVCWRDVWPAAILTALLLSMSRYLIEFYLRFSTTSEIYGAAGSLVVLLIWIYISGMVLFYGAAFSRAWSETFGSRQHVDP